MPILRINDVQQWLQRTKYGVTTVDIDLEDTARVQVFGALSARYNTSLWTDDQTTPVLVRKAIGMLVAAWTYNRAVAEDVTVGEETGYGVRLEQRANLLVKGVLADSIDIGVEPSADLQLTNSLSFFPMDSSDPDHERKFTMGQVF